jgi:hypothetical protein
MNTDCGSLRTGIEGEAVRGQWRAFVAMLDLLSDNQLFRKDGVCTGRRLTEQDEKGSRVLRYSELPV